MYPNEIDLAGMGIQPDVSYLYRDNRAPRFPLAFYRGEVPKTAFGGSGPVDLLPTRAGSPAELWEAAPTARDDGTAHALLLYRVVFRFGSWSVVAYVGDRHDAEVVASSLAGRETPDGFIALEAFSPIALSDESGEGESSRVTIGDVEPDPNRAGSKGDSAISRSRSRAAPTSTTS
jgi:hypothetical protein